MALNTKRLAAIITEIEAHPETWNQWEFEVNKPECGTSFCVAGFASRDASSTDQARAALWVQRDNCTFSYWNTGKKWLGLTEAQATYLFNCSRTLPEIKAFLETQGEIPDSWVDHLRLLRQGAFL